LDALAEGRENFEEDELLTGLGHSFYGKGAEDEGEEGEDEEEDASKVVALFALAFGWILVRSTYQSEKEAVVRGGGTGSESCEAAVTARTICRVGVVIYVANACLFNGGGTGGC